MESVEWSAPVEIRSEGRELRGPVVRYGDIAPTFRERFGPGAFTSVADPLPLNIEHDRSSLVADRLAVEHRSEALAISTPVDPSSAASRLIRAGALTGLSAEFVARREHRENGIRVITDAHLAGVALVHNPAYKGSRIEYRSSLLARMRSGIVPERRNSCECSGRECSYASFTVEALEAEAEAINAGRDVVAAWGSYDNPLGSTGRGTVRVDWQADGESGFFGIELDLPDNEAGRKVLDAQADAGIVVRPFLDQRRSVGERIGEVMAYSAIFTRAFIVSATDAREGWPEPRLLDVERDALGDRIDTTEPEIEPEQRSTRRRFVL